ncbi:MAG TPA: VOC family protein [Thermomicrobiales bacterium]|nr:VOC family protein [Thermomicrobiales bacterium]
MIATTVSTLPRLHHVMIAIPPASEPTARAFYVEILGLIETPKPDSLCGRGGLWLSTGSLDVHLGIDQDFHPARKAHIALQFPNLEQLRRRLNEHGYQVGPVECELPGYQRFYVSDPFGNRIELMELL